MALQDYFKKALGRLDLTTSCTEINKFPFNCISMLIKDSKVGKIFIKTERHSCQIIWLFSQILLRQYNHQNRNLLHAKRQ